MNVDLAIVKISMEFSEECIQTLKQISSVYGFEVKYLCHGTIPVKFRNDEIILRSYVRLSAARSRNLLYRRVHSSRIMFLDEDASLSTAALRFLANFVHTNERCNIIFSGKRNVNVAKRLKLNDLNFYRINKFYCEWNIVYDKVLVENDRLFPGIGVGSRHEFWSGEGICSLLNIKSNSLVYLRPEEVLHPPLSHHKDYAVARKYIKGYGFTMGYIFKRGSVLLKLFTIMRFCFSLTRDILYPKSILPRIDTSNIFSYGVHSVIWKVQGFIWRKR